MLYLDYCATTPIHEEVLKTYQIINKEYWGNPSSLHKFGTVASNLFEKAKLQVTDVLKASDYQVIFTSGATEANNIAVSGIAHQYKSRGRHIITTVVEHSSVFETMEMLEENGFEVTYLKVTENGLVNLNELKQALRKDTILVSTMYVNGELGTIMPIKEISRIIKSSNPNIFYHVDMVQGFGKLPVHLKEMGVDLASFSGHKIYGPKGVGALVVHKQINLAPIGYGGGQQYQIRSGTIDVASSVCLSKAMRLISEIQEKNLDYVKKLNHMFYEELRKCDFLTLNSSEETSSPYIINFSLHNIKAETFVSAMSEYEIYISSKSACSSKTNKPSRILKAIGRNDLLASQSIRISLSHLTKVSDVERFFKIFYEVINEVMVK